VIRTTRFVTELKCKNCGIVQLRGETFTYGKRCCDNSRPSVILGEREIVEYTKTNEEERAEMMEEMERTND